MKKHFPFSAREKPAGKKPGFLIIAGRCFSGLAGMAIVYLGLRLILPGEASLFSGIQLWGRASPYYEIGRFIRYGLVGLWAAAGAPWLFQRIGLAPCNINLKEKPE
jgi:hypothetical protein